MPKSKMLSEQIADDILNMITIEKRFTKGEKLPNENQLSQELKVSRTTLREAIRILVTNQVLEIRRGKGTFVTDNSQLDEGLGIKNLVNMKVNARDLYEMRLIFEPEAAYYATQRATENELKRILHYGRKVEKKILANEDRIEEEQAFHKSIAKATHNEFMNKLMPIIYQSINKGVSLSKVNDQLIKDTLNDHRMIMEFLEKRNPEGARTAMKLHIIHAMEELDM